MDFELLLENCEAAIRAGRASEVGRRLASLNLAQVPDTYRLRLANLCRRVGLNTLGMRLLTPLVLVGQTKRGARASDAVLSEYAVLLQRCGAVDEALRMLSKIDVRANPQALLSRAFCFFNRWEYDAAIPVLQEYLESGIEPYQRLVGRVNLAAALIATDNVLAARGILSETIELARDGNYVRLEGNCLELRGQAALMEDDYSAARDDLRAASQLIGGESGLGSLFVQKWMAVLDAMEKNELAPLEEFRATALAKKDWEGVRDVDFYRLRIEFNETRYLHLLFGSPFRAYRERLSRQFARAEHSGDFLYGAPESPILDLQTGIIGEQAILTPGGKVHQAIEAMLRDFYRPMRIGGMFSALFPDEHFDIFSSPGRVHQVLRRLRRECEEHDLPIAIKGQGGEYALNLIGPLAVRLQYDRLGVTREALAVEKLREKFNDSWGFSAREAAEALGISVFAFRRLVPALISSKRLEKFGSSSATLYRLAGPRMVAA